ncbi:MAG: hypothetical protein AABZ06_11730 [Bdellovibrionota bacterium]
MTKNESKARILEIKKALESFPKEVRRQARAHREQIKVQKAFGKLSFTSKKTK